MVRDYAIATQLELGSLPFLIASLYDAAACYMSVSDGDSQLEGRLLRLLKGRPRKLLRTLGNALRVALRRLLHR